MARKAEPRTRRRRRFDWSSADRRNPARAPAPSPCRPRRLPAGIAHSTGYRRGAAQPDLDIECIGMLQPAHPVGVGALAAGLHARLGKRLRWFGRGAGATWEMLASATRGEFVEVAACMLLADRNGAASHAQIDTFVRVLGDLAPLLPAAMSVPDVGAETDRAEALDQLCADVDVQVGLTVLKSTRPASRERKPAGRRRSGRLSARVGRRVSSGQRRTPAPSIIRCRMCATSRSPSTRCGVGHEWRGPCPRRSARGGPAACLRPDEADRQAHRAHARTVISSTTTGARSTTRRWPPYASKCRSRRRRVEGLPHRSGKPARAGAVRRVRR